MVYSATLVMMRPGSQLLSAIHTLRLASMHDLLAAHIQRLHVTTYKSYVLTEDRGYHKWPLPSFVVLHSTQLAMTATQSLLPHKTIRDTAMNGFHSCCNDERTPCCISTHDTTLPHSLKDLTPNFSASQMNAVLDW
jgi:hypothetical protein